MKYCLLFAAFIATSLLHAQDLDRRAAKFADLIADTDAPQGKYVKRLVRYFDPQTNADSTAQAHYDWWLRNEEEDSYPLSWSVLGIDYPSENEGLVRTETYWHYPGGETVRFIVQTKWIRLDNEWYRTQEPQEILESEEMNVIDP